jgi:ribosomal protein S12 methylthiotransferase accessory factor
MANVRTRGRFVKTSNAHRPTAKVVTRGTHRSQSLAQTIDRVWRLAPVMGITRVANVTGLDVVGVPVVMVSRPNSRSVTVSQGKGIDLASAKASGLMEAAELYHAETATLPLRLATYEELRFKHKIVNIEDLPRGAGSHFHPNLRILWCEGRDLLTGDDVLVPYEMVHTNYTIPLPDGHGCFTSSSNGLASGNALVEAISQGICEVIERDAVALWKVRKKKGPDRRRLDLESVDDSLCRETIAKFQHAGLFVAAWDITSDIKISTFACLAVPEDDTTTWHCSVAAGYGCHPARDVALLRALTEAAQTRLTLISGLRDDFRGDTYEQLLDPDVIKSKRKEVRHSAPTRRFSEVPSRNEEIFEKDVDWELKCLSNGGLQRVVAIDLTKPEFGLPVVRVIVPGLEPIPASGSSPGRRARLAIAGKA